MSVGCVQSQIRPPSVGFNITAHFELEESPRHRAPAPHPTTGPQWAQPARLRQTSIRPVAPFCPEAYASKDRRCSVTRPATNKNPFAFEPPVRNARPISPIRSQCGADLDSNHSLRSSSYSTPRCTKSSSESTKLQQWNDGLLWPVTAGRTNPGGSIRSRSTVKCRPPAPETLPGAGAWVAGFVPAILRRLRQPPKAPRSAAAGRILRWNSRGPARCGNEMPTPGTR